jgi:hypothetical protein
VKRANARLLKIVDNVSDRLQRRAFGNAVLRREHGLAEAERVVVRALKAQKVKPQDLGRMRKSNERKILIGALVRKATMASNGWIAKRLVKGDPTQVSRYCSQQRWMEDAHSLGRLSQLEKMSICKG